MQPTENDLRIQSHTGTVPGTHRPCWHADPPDSEANRAAPHDDAYRCCWCDLVVYGERPATDADRHGPAAPATPDQGARRGRR